MRPLNDSQRVDSGDRRTEKPQIIVHVATASPVKLEGVRRALALIDPETEFVVVPCPVELQDRDDLHVNAQPFTPEETQLYAAMRLNEMKRKYGPADLYIAIESGAMDGDDVAILLVASNFGPPDVFVSRGIPFPVITTADGRVVDTLDEASRCGPQTTAGDIIHKLRPEIPANDWHASFTDPPMSRADQIADGLTYAAARVMRLIEEARMAKLYGARPLRTARWGWTGPTL